MSRELSKMSKELLKDQKYILVVDDDMRVRTILSSILRREGYRVTAVKDSCEAIKAIDKENFDLALVDLGMPTLDGIEVLEHIKNRRPQVSVIIYTGQGSITTAVAVMRKGATDYLVRPFSPQRLKRSVEKALEDGQAQSCI